MERFYSHLFIYNTCIANVGQFEWSNEHITARKLRFYHVNELLTSVNSTKEKKKIQNENNKLRDGISVWQSSQAQRTTSTQQQKLGPVSPDQNNNNNNKI